MAIAPLRLARWYFGAQAVAGSAWWIAVALNADVRRLTLGTWPIWPWAIADVLLFVGASAWASIRSSRRAAWTAAGWSVIVTGALAVSATAWRTHGWGAAGMVVASVGSLVAAAVFQFGRLPTAWFFIGPFRFRPAADRSVGGHVRRSLAQLVLFWSFFLIALPALAQWVERRWRIDAPWLANSSVRWAGVGVFAVASAAGLWSCLTMAVHGRGTPLPAATATRLVVAGPYRWVRNPMAVAGALQTIGIGAWFGSWSVAVLALAGGGGWDGGRPPRGGGGGGGARNCAGGGGGGLFRGGGCGWRFVL
ncbi:MAG TPA: hypothetical protein DCR14_19045, partial [Acidimicrobiaceae bacterium]|nr:hypothetical protein [Acidimicrobiaceae bacterium]